MKNNRIWIGGLMFAILVLNHPRGLAAGGEAAEGAPANDVLWLGKPAATWEREVFPLGNGRLGCTVFGGIAEERIQFNVDSLWTGDENPGGGYRSPGMGFYQNFGDLYIALDGGAEATDYRRELNLSRAVSTVSYEQGGTRFTRETFCSHPDQVIVTRLSASAGAKYSGRIRLVGGREEKVSAAENRLGFSGTLPNGLQYEARVLISADGGTLKPDGDALVFSGCDSLTLTLAAATDYLLDHSKNWRAGKPGEQVKRQAEAAAGRTYSTLLERHVKDHQSLFRRAAVDLGTSAEAQRTLPLDARLKAVRTGTADPELEALFFQYGRYMLIASSRPGTLPANLQGVWNHVNDPAWHGDYHSNINLQMNYWPAEVANLAECHTPLFDLLTESVVPFRTASRKAFGQGVRGFTVRTSHNPFGGGGWKWNLPGSAWYARHFWEHYEFGRDQEFLKNVAYPYLKEVCHFWEDRLKELPDGRLVVPDGWSPEHGPVEDGVSYDQQIVWDLFSNTIAAATELDVDADYRAKLATMRDKLVGPKIGKWGQLQEWMEDRDDPKDQHRHVSHLYAVYPAHQIAPATTPELAEAAKVSLNARGDGGTGWGRAWKIALWARLGDANRAHKIIRDMLANNFFDNGFDSIFDDRPPFQIDGNLGYPAAVAEMLVQSQTGTVHLLPALPDAWPAGSARGLRARGGYEVDLAWKDGKLAAATVRETSNHPGPCKLRYGNTTITVELDKGQAREIKPEEFAAAGSGEDRGHADGNSPAPGLANIDLGKLQPDLTPPPVTDGEPAPGRRVRQFHKEYTGSEVYHTLYLPTDWKRGASYPVIVEYAGNKYAFGNGEVDSCKLGYGISGGTGVIWVCLPFVDSEHLRNATSWWGDVDATVAYCRRTVQRVCLEYGGDSSRVFLAGFSRGAIACNFIGLHDDDIASLWRGFICHSHYDGSHRWPGTTPEGALERLKRLKGRPQFISHEGSVDPTRRYLAETLPDGNFTFLALPFPDHTDTWVLRDLPERARLREWFQHLVTTP